MLIGVIRTKMAKSQWLVGLLLCQHM